MKKKNKYSRIRLIKLLIILCSVSAIQFSCSSSDNNNSDTIDRDGISKVNDSTKDANNTPLPEEIQDDGKEPVDIHFAKFIGNESVRKLSSINDFEEAINNAEFETIDESDFFIIFNFEINHSVEISNPKILAYYSHNDTTKLWLVKTDGDVHCPEDSWLIHTGKNDFYYHKKINIRTFCLGDMQPCSEFGRTEQGNIFLKTGAAYYSLDSTRYGVPFGQKIYTKTCIYDINLNLLKTDSIDSGSNDKNNTSVMSSLTSRKIKLFMSSKRGIKMIKYVITLSTSEREELEAMTSKGIHLSTKIKSALILLNCDTSEHSKRYTNQTISDIVHISTKTIDRVKKRFVEEGYDAIFNPPKPKRTYIKKADGEVEAHLVALCCGEPPSGFAKWSLRLLADKMVELNYIESISHETVRQVLKKTNLNLGKV